MKNQIKSNQIKSIKKIPLTLIALVIFIASHAQIKVESDGKVLIGNKLSVSTTSGPVYINPITGLGYIGNIYQFEQIRSSSFWSYQYQVTSDKRLKTNIRIIDNPLKKVTQLSAKKYDYIAEGTDSIGSANEKENKQNLKKDRLGFFAQDVLTVVPEAVIHDKEKDQYYLDYDAFIPLLVEAMKEQQTHIEALEARLEKLENSNPNMKSATNENTTSTKENLLANTATLAQNIPNPFTNNTRIGITLPVTVKNARLYVYNMQGAQIKSFNINERGATSVTIEGYTLQAGMYLYTLIADGKEVDTKKMILTK